MKRTSLALTAAVALLLSWLAVTLPVRQARA